MDWLNFLKKIETVLLSMLSYITKDPFDSQKEKSYCSLRSQQLCTQNGQNSPFWRMAVKAIKIAWVCHAKSA